MLVLTRKKDERIYIGSDIEVVVLAIQGNRVRLGFIAPDDVPIVRDEIKGHAKRAIPQESTIDATRPTVPTAYLTTATIAALR